MRYTIRDLVTYDEILQVHHLQREIWGLSEPMFGLYPPLINTIAHNGGTVLGAFDAESGAMVAFLVGFLGREKGGPLKLCSQAMGVRPEWRRHGVAQALKLAQRQRVIEQGLLLITWTYDPLEGPNATLNLHKLRAISRRYMPDVYGSNFGALNAGLPTDRLLVEWWVRGEHLAQPMRPELGAAVPIFELAGQGLERHIVDTRFDLRAESLLLETVADLHPVKAANLDLALDWRLRVRAAFETYFARGYLATDFISMIDPADGHRYNRYLLQKNNPLLRAKIGMID